MKQIYEIIYNLCNVDARTDLGYKLITFTNRLDELPYEESSFLCLYVMQHQLNYPERIDEMHRHQKKFDSKWFKSRKRFDRVSRILIDKNILHRVGKQYKFVINPEYNPTLSKNERVALSSRFNKMASKINRGSMKESNDEALRQIDRLLNNSLS